MPVKKGKSPFSPSWVDRFFDWVERLPIPFWLFYALAYALLVFIYHLLLWADGSLPVGSTASILFAQNIWFVFIAAVWHYIRITTGQVLDRFRPALQISAAEFNDLRFSYTHLPASVAWVLTAIGAPFILFAYRGFSDYMGPLFFSPYTRYLTIGFGAFIFPINLGAFYNVFRTSVNVTRLYGRVKKINLFNLTALHSLSSLTSRVGIVFVVFFLLNIVTAPLYGGDLAAAFETFYLVLIGALAIAVFLLPLLGMHQRLVSAKQDATEENNRLIEGGFAKMQSLVRKGKHAKVPELRASNSALLEYRQELNKISTWPWDTSTLRTFITALLVPMTIWVVQQVLLRTVVK